MKNYDKLLFQKFFERVFNFSRGNVFENHLLHTYLFSECEWIKKFLTIESCKIKEKNNMKYLFKKVICIKSWKVVFRHYSTDE